MAGNIKGITIEFRGDTTKLDSALRKINGETRKLDNELRKVDKALKFNPTSVQLWGQKQQLLTEKIQKTEERLKVLKEAQKKLDAKNVDKNSEEYRNLQREIIEAESKLKTFKAQLQKIGNVRLKGLSESFKKVGSQMQTLGKSATRYITTPIVAAYAAATKASLNYGDAMAKVATLADESQVPVKQLSSEILDLSNQTGKGAAELAEAAYQALSASVQTKDLTEFLKGSAALAKAGFLETADAVDVLTTIINAYGMSASDADIIANQLIQTQNDGKTTVNELAQAMGQVIPTAAALNVPLEQLNAAYAAMTMQGMNTANTTTAIKAMLNELSKEGSTTATILQNETGKTFGELMQSGATLGDVLGILSNSVNGNSEEFKNLFGNVRAGTGALSLLNYGCERYNQETAKMVESTGNVNKALSELSTPGAEARKAWNELVNVGIQVGDILAPYVLKLAEGIQVLVDKFNNLSPETQKTIVMIGLIAAAIGPVLTIVGGLASAIGTVIGVVGRIIPMLSSLIPIITTILGVIGPAGAIFLGVAAAIMAAALIIYKNWDKVKAKAVEVKTAVVNAWNNVKSRVSSLVASLVSGVTSRFNALKSRVTTIFSAVKNAIAHPIQTAQTLVKKAIDKIKSVLSTKLSLPKIKLPHFSISGKLSLNPPSVPHLSVSWYKQGGIFNSPTIAGIGEAGAEAVVPLDKFWNKLEGMSGGVTNNFNLTINGAEDPEAWGRRFVRTIELEMRAT